VVSERSASTGSTDGGSPSRSQTDRRITALLVALALIGAPAVVLRALCVGKACLKHVSVTATVPFCSLPDGLRTLVHSGFRAGRSPDVLGVTRGATIVGGTDLAADAPRTPWPSASTVADAAVPIVFAGSSVTPGSTVPDGAGLDQIAPTEARLLDYDRPHPEVRSGQAIESVDASASPRLILQIVWQGVGSTDLQKNSGRWPHLEQLMASGASTMKGEARSLPLDPAATLTTIGTGGLPYQHGIVSSIVLNDAGQLVPAWGPGAPVSVIATLSDDLDHDLHEQARIGLVASDRAERGVIGGNWYIDADTDDVDIVASDKVVSAGKVMLDESFGADEVPDILTVVQSGSVEEMDAGLEKLAAAAEQAAPGSALIVVTATGSLSTGKAGVVSAEDVTKEVETAIPGSDRVVQAAAPGGLYLDQKTLAKDKITDDAIIEALEGAQSESGRPLMDQVFPAIAISFSRYC
jgi:hypothetical protein